MALRSRLVTDSHHLLRIINDMSSDDNLSNEDDNHSISLMLGLVWGFILDITLQLQDCIRERYGSHVANPDSLRAFVFDA